MRSSMNRCLLALLFMVMVWFSPSVALGKSVAEGSAALGKNAPMELFLDPIKQSASSGYERNVFLAATSDSNTGVGGLTVTVEICKYGQTSFVTISRTVDDLGLGCYKVHYTSADINTLGPLYLRVSGAGVFTAVYNDLVVAYDPSDPTRLGLLALPNNNANASGGLPTIGTGAGQINTNGTGGVDVNMAQALPSNPTASTVGEALWFEAGKIGRRGTAQAGGANTITLDSSASSTDGTYVGYLINITGGTGAGQKATVSGYVGSTKVATIQRRGGASGWTITPDSTSVFLIEPVEQANVGMILGTPLSASKVPATLATGDVTGNLPAQVNAYNTGLAPDSLVWGASVRTLSAFGFNVNLASTQAFNNTGQTSKLPATVATGDGADSATALTRIGAPTGASVSADIGTLLGRLSNTRATGLDFLDVAVSSRMATFSYTAPDNAGISGIKTTTDKFAFTGTGPYLVNSQVKGIDSAVSDAIAAATLAGLIDGSITFKQAQALQLSINAGKYTAGGINTSTHTNTITYYRQDGTTVLAVGTITYNTANTVITGRTLVFSNLP